MDRTEWAGLIMLGAIVVLPAIALVVAYLFRRLENEERLRAIEKGLSVSFNPLETALRTRRSALALIGAGAGTVVAAMGAATKLGSHMVAGAGLGLIPLGAGLALAFDYWLQRRDIARDK
jgi:hypothetical protein